jgi:hypothetical protein
MKSKLTIGQLIGLAASLLVLLAFFVPWIEVNLLLASTNISGYQLATGSGPGGTNFTAVSSLLLVPVCMLGVLVLVAACLLMSSSPAKSLAGTILIVAGGISALIILYQYFTLNQELNRDVLGMITQRMFSYTFGAHASLLGSVLVVGGGLIDFVFGPRTKQPLPLNESIKNDMPQL